ncbi:alpha/beta fold hydrolase [Streptomyces sp. NPDC005811]|uniref:thioesterase II family protein n=1 Tax=Streptomyces sp. NPDC005811 TaxID=3154565 RepID=UPI0033D298A5
MTTTSTREATGTWFRCFRGVADPRVRLVCLPHAGGTANLFAGWPARLPSDVELLAVRYPGRQDRLAEPCIEDMDELADRITEAVLPLTDRPVALFGHSMGSSVAYEVARRLEGRHGVVPAHLLVSGRVAPHRTPRTTLHLTDDEALISAARALGDLGSSVFDIPELRELLMPALRADYRLIERYEVTAPQILDTPVTAYVGDRDPGSSRVLADVAAWAELTRRPGCEVISFPGDHFYLAPCEAELVADVTARLATVRSSHRLRTFP